MPDFIVIGGPNGAGKSTAAPHILRDTFGVLEFVNADDVARGLSGFAPEEVAFEAGRIVLSRLRELASSRRDFAFESTLSGRSLAPFIRDVKGAGYRFHLFYLWLPGPEASLERVRKRVSEGGHDIPEAAVRRRYLRGLRNFYGLYRPLADRWELFDNSHTGPPILVARGSGSGDPLVIRPETWNNVIEVCS